MFIIILLKWLKELSDHKKLINLPAGVVCEQCRTVYVTSAFLLAMRKQRETPAPEGV